MAGALLVGEPAEFEVLERTDSSCLISGILRNLDAVPFSVGLGCYAGDDVAAMTEPALPYLFSRLVATLSSPVGYLGDVLLAEVGCLAMASLEACRGVVLLGCVVVALRDAGVLDGVVVAPLEAIF